MSCERLKIGLAELTITELGLENQTYVVNNGGDGMGEKMITTLKSDIEQKADPKQVKKEFSDRLKIAAESSAPIRSRISFRDATSQLLQRISSKV